MAKPSEEETAAGDICGALCGILGTGVDIHRCLAARSLGRIGDPGAVPTLIDALLDEDEDVRTDAAQALAHMADPRAAKQLLENLLGDPCADVKLAAIEALVRLKDPAAVPWLLRLLKGRDESVVWDEEAFFHDDWDDWTDIQIKSVEGLAALGIEKAVPGIVEIMADEHGQDMSETAFKALVRLGEPGINALAVYLDDSDVRRRRRAAAALAGVDHEAAIDPTTRALKDPSPEVRLAAAKPMAARNPSDQRLTVLFEDDAPQVRSWVVEKLAVHYRDRLLHSLEDPSHRVQTVALKVLAENPGHDDDGALASALRTKLNSPSSEVGNAAALALAAIDPDGAVTDLKQRLEDAEQSLETRTGAIRGLAGIGGATALEAIVDVIGDGQRQIRLEAIGALKAMAREHWPNRAGEALLAALRGELVPEPASDEGAVGKTVDADPQHDDSMEEGDKEDTVVAFPTTTLGSIMLAESAPPDAFGLPDTGVELTPMDMERLALARRIKGKRCMPVVPRVSPHRDVRRFAARVLGDLDFDDVATGLSLALKDDDAELRTAAADSLARIGSRRGSLPGEAVDALLKALPGADRDSRLLIIRGLGTVENESAAEVLERYLGDEDSFVRTEAIRALSLAGAANPALVGLLKDPDPGVRLAAAQAMAATGGESATDHLVEFAMAFEGYYRRDAGRLLRNLNVERANARFLEVLADRETLRVWPAVIEALEELNLPDQQKNSGVTPAGIDEYRRSHP